MFRWDFNIACRISSSIISVDRLSGKKWKWWSHWYGLTVYMLSVLDAQDIAVGIVMYANLLDTVAATATTSFMFSTIVRDHTACSWTSSWLVQWPLSEAQASTPYTFTTYMAPFEGLERWVKKLQLVSYTHVSYVQIQMKLFYTGIGHGGSCDTPARIGSIEWTLTLGGGRILRAPRSKYLPQKRTGEFFSSVILRKQAV